MHATSAVNDSQAEPSAPTRKCSWPACLDLIPILPWLFMVVKFRHLGDTIVRQHDNLDSFQATVSRMSWADLFAAPGTMLPYLLGGLPRDFLGSEFGLANLIGVALPLMWSIFVAEFLIRTIAFYGMTTLLRTAGIGDYKIITYGTATVFALLPFYTPAFGAVAAVPFLLTAFLRTLQSGRLDLRSAAIFALFPFVASAVATIPYVAFLLLAV
ncbi:MAG: DUF6044 family protein, partial [Actinomycetota bacterium]|nr:DUF6044 family protein [Actinomycetota bacterium]